MWLTWANRRRALALDRPRAWRQYVAAFTKLDWRRLDVRAIVGGSGLAVVEMKQRPAHQEWLEQEG